MHHSRFLLILCGWLLACQATIQNRSLTQIPSNNPMQTRLDSLVDKVVSEWMKDSAKVGLSLGICRAGKTYQYHYGSTDKAVQKLPNGQTVYEIASLTKTFTGTILAQSLHQNDLQLEDDLRDYLPEEYPNLSYNGAYIALKHLATHQSGLPHAIPYDPAMWEAPDFDKLPFQLIELEKDYTPKDWLRELHQVQLDTIPGSITFQYSNIGVNLLAIALENKYGQSYPELVRQWVLEPLDMRQTYFRLRAIDPERLAKGYNHNGVRMPYLLDNAYAAGGIRSCLTDMLKYAAFHLKETGAIPQIAHKPVTTYGDSGYAAGLFWQIYQPEGEPRKIFQSGGAFGFSSMIQLHPAQELGFVLLSNESGPESQEQLSEIAAQLQLYFME